MRTNFANFLAIGVFMKNNVFLIILASIFTLTLNAYDDDKFVVCVGGPFDKGKKIEFVASNKTPTSFKSQFIGGFSIGLNLINGALGLDKKISITYSGELSSVEIKTIGDGSSGFPTHLQLGDTTVMCFDGDPHRILSNN